MKPLPINSLLLDTREPSSNDLKLILSSTFIISLLLSLSQIVADSIIGNDGIFYMHIASLFQAGDPEGANAIYNKPFYSYLISQVSTLTSLSLERVAHILNALFSATMCVTFILIVRQLGGRKGVLLLAATIILCFPKLNEYRSMIMRDHGYWAFYLLTTFFYFRLYQIISFKNILFFLSSAILASLFRVEGLIILPLLSLSLFWRHRKGLCCILSNNKLYSALALLIVFSISLGLLISVWGGDSFTFLGKLQEVGNKLISFIPTANPENPAIESAKTFLNSLTSPADHSEGYAKKVLVLTVLLILLSETLGTLGFLYSIGMIATFYRNSIFKKQSLRAPWLHLVIINICVLIAFLSMHFFLSGRYPIALSITLLLLLPFFLSRILPLYNEKKHIKSIKVTAYIVFILFVFSSFDGVMSFGAKKDYLREAGQWLSSRVNNNPEKLYTNTPQIKYYARAIEKKLFPAIPFSTVLEHIAEGSLKSYRYIAIKISRKNPNHQYLLSSALKNEPVKVFTNKRGDKVYIFHQEEITPKNL